MIHFFQDEISKYIDSHEGSNALMKFRKAALKARHKAHLEQERQQIEKEIEQSVNELKLQLEVNRLKAVEKQVNLYFFRVGTPAKFLKFILHPQTRNLISSFSISNGP